MTEQWNPGDKAEWQYDGVIWEPVTVMRVFEEDGFEDRERCEIRLDGPVRQGSTWATSLACIRRPQPTWKPGDRAIWTRPSGMTATVSVPVTVVAVRGKNLDVRIDGRPHVLWHLQAEELGLPEKGSTAPAPVAEPPIAVGDYVRWENGRIWVEGEVVEIHRPQITLVARIRVDRSNRPTVGTVQSVGIDAPCRVWRVERPAARVEQPSVGDYVRWENPKHGTWVEGELTQLTDDGIRILVSALCPWPTRTGGPRAGQCTGLGLSGVTLRRIERPTPAPAAPTADPLDTLYDCETLRSLLALDEANRRGENLKEVNGERQLWLLTAAQREAVSAYWSAQLRARVAESDAASRLTVMVEIDPEDL